ncbi:MAG: fibronectin type III domain-containing protein [Thermoplasmata archaeon]|nr:fibronectin type III domain-containing protein [Thermoplasmata archaeon]
MSRSVRRGYPRLVALLLGVLLAIVLIPYLPSNSGEQVSYGHLTPAVAIIPSTFPIQHVVFVLLENHAYDNYFGVYCQALSSLCPVTGNGIPAGDCVNMTPGSVTGGCIRPFALNASYVNVSLGGSHNYGASHKSYDGGKMDGFYAAAPHLKQVLGYYNGSTIPAYWNLAESYGLGDNFFSSALSYSLPNHWFMVAGAAPLESENPFGAFSRQGVAAPLSGGEMQYLNQSNATPALDDELVNSSTTWRYYDDSTNNQSFLAALNETVHGVNSQPSVFDYWNPLISKAETYNYNLNSHFVPRGNFFNDTKNGTLPNVSWIIPAGFMSDHPPDNLNNGMGFVSSIADAVMNSSLWKSTAIFVSYDEYGGYYDHVAPPQIDQWGLGFRVPVYVISAYTPEGYISHVQTRFESVLHLMEWRFGLSNLTFRDGLAALPLDYFDLNATPRAPDLITMGNPYPMPQQIQLLKRVSGLTIVTSPTGANLTWGETSGTAPVAGYNVRYGTAHGHITSANLPRTQTSLAIAGLACNSTYSVSVLSFAGANRSIAVTLRATTGSCGVGGVAGGGRMISLVAVGEKGRFDARLVPAHTMATGVPPVVRGGELAYPAPAYLTPGSNGPPGG